MKKAQATKNFQDILFRENITDAELIQEIDNLGMSEAEFKALIFVTLKDIYQIIKKGEKK